MCGKNAILYNFNVNLFTIMTFIILKIQLKLFHDVLISVLFLVFIELLYNVLFDFRLQIFNSINYS